MENHATQGKTRVLWVDDNPDLLELYAELFNFRWLADFESVGFLSTLDKLEEEIATRSPDLVVLDLSMPGRNPLEAMRACLATSAAVRFVIYSAHDQGFIIERAVAAGAAAYKVKDGNLEALTQCLRRVAEGERVFPETRA
jgi:DNA-binding NarL/FixJ family response regulator